MPGFLEEKKDFAVKNGFGCVFYFIDHSFCETGLLSFFLFSDHGTTNDVR
jgi:hypothetical protein